MDCIDYYGEKEAEYTKECDYQKVWAFRHTLGIAFVTFENEQVANKCAPQSRPSQFISTFSTYHCAFEEWWKTSKCRVWAPIHRRSRHSVKPLSVNNWEVKYAPSYEDLYWLFGQDFLFFNASLCNSQAILFIGTTCRLLRTRGGCDSSVWTFCCSSSSSSWPPRPTSSTSSASPTTRKRCERHIFPSWPILFRPFYSGSCLRCFQTLSTTLNTTASAIGQSKHIYPCKLLLK